ncbi:MAG: GNAT family N-acetyltransferase [Candidatus Acidiferrales bacterium]
MKLKFVTRTLVYEYASAGTDVSAPVGLDGDDWRFATREAVESVFRDDPERICRFRSYLNARHTGHLLLRGGRWVSYGWCRAPRCPGPPHLPRSTDLLGAYWIFGCHTHRAHRRQGIYKQLLVRLIAQAGGKGPSPKIYIDTHAENTPSRCAILGSGFRPCGIFLTYRVWSPFGGAHIVGGSWRRDAPHPNLEREVDNIPVLAITGKVSYKSYAG